MQMAVKPKNSWRWNAGIPVAAVLAKLLLLVAIAANGLACRASYSAGCPEAFGIATVSGE